MNKKSRQREMDSKGNYVHVHANHYDKTKTLTRQLQKGKLNIVDALTMWKISNSQGTIHGLNAEKDSMGSNVEIEARAESTRHFQYSLALLPLPLRIVRKCSSHLKNRQKMSSILQANLDSRLKPFKTRLSQRYMRPSKTASCFQCVIWARDYRCD